VENVNKNEPVKKELLFFVDDCIESYTDEMRINIKWNKDASQVVLLEQVVTLPPWLLLQPVSEGVAQCKFD